MVGGEGNWVGVRLRRLPSWRFGDVGLSVMVGDESSVPGLEESERSPAEGSYGVKKGWVREQLCFVGGRGGFPRGFEQLSPESYKLPALQEEVVNIFDLLTQVAFRGVDRTEAVQVIVEWTVA